MFNVQCFMFQIMLLLAFEKKTDDAFSEVTSSKFFFFLILLTSIAIAMILKHFETIYRQLVFVVVDCSKFMETICLGLKRTVLKRIRQVFRFANLVFAVAVALAVDLNVESIWRLKFNEVELFVRHQITAKFH